MTGKREAGGDVREAVSTLVDAIAERVHEVPPKLDVGDLLRAFTTSVGPRDVSPVRAQVAMVVDRYNRACATGVNQINANLAVGQLAGVLLAGDQVSASFDRDVELQAAAAELAEAQEAKRRALAELEQAVSEARVDDVLALRTELEVLAPQRLERAQAAVFELKVAQAEQAAIPARARLAATGEAVAAAESAHVAAVEALETAKQAYDHARLRHALAERVSEDVGRGLEQLRAQRDAAASQAKVDSAERLRRLAGLSAPPASQSESLPPSRPPDGVPVVTGSYFSGSS